MPHSRKTRVGSGSGRTSQSRPPRAHGGHGRRQPRALDHARRARRRRVGGGAAPPAACRRPASPPRRRRGARRPSSSRRSVSPSAPTGAWSSTTKTRARSPTSSASQYGSTRFSHGMSTTCTDVPSGGEQFGARSAPRAASRARRRAAARRRPRAATVPRPGVTSSAGSSMRRGEGPIASRIATRLLRFEHGPLDERARLLGRARVDDRDAGEGGEQRGVAQALVRLARPGGDQTGVVEGVDDLRALARLVVDLLVRAGGEEAREGVDDREQSLAGEARPPRRPCPARRCPSRRTGRGGRARSRAHGSRRRGRRRERRAAVRARPGRAAPRRTPPRRTRPSRSAGASPPRRPTRARRRGPTPAPAPASHRLEPQRLEAECGRAAPRSARAARRARGRRSRRPGRRRASGTCRPRRAAPTGCSMKETPFPLIVCATRALRPPSPASRKSANAARRAPRGRDRRRRRRASRTRAAWPPGRRARRISSVGLVGLELVPVDDDPEPAEPLVRGALQRLPVLPFLQLAVAGHHDHAAAAAEVPLRPRHAAPLRDPHPERARVRLDPRHADVGMAVEPAEPAQPQQTLGRDDAERMQHGVEARHVVPLRGEEDVAVRGAPSRAPRRSARRRGDARRCRAR